MATITIRNLPEDLVERIKKQAADQEHSMEAELREMLGHCYRDRAAMQRAVEEGHRHMLRPVTGEEIDSWKRMGRP